MIQNYSTDKNSSQSKQGALSFHFGSKREKRRMLIVRHSTSSPAFRSHFLVQVIHSFHISDIKRETKHLEVLFNSGRSHTFWDHCITWRRSDRVRKGVVFNKVAECQEVNKQPDCSHCSRYMVFICFSVC